MLLLLALFIGLSLSQSATSPFTPVSPLTNNSAANAKQTTKGADVKSFSAVGESSLTGDEKYFVYSSDVDGAGGAVATSVFSVPSGGTFQDAKQLSFVFSKPIGSWLFSPSQQIVTFTSSAQTAGIQLQLFSVGIGGGTPVLLNPNIPNTALNYYPHPCPCNNGAATDGQILFDGVPSAKFQGGFINELWVNSITGGTPKKINVDLQQSASLPQTKSLTLLERTWRDWILYQANPGPNQGLDPMHIYMVDWFGVANYQITPSTQFNVSTDTPQIIRNGCSSTGQYIAFTTNGQSKDFQSLYVYDLTNKRLLNGGAAINPALDASMVLRPGTWVGDRFFFTVTSGTIPNTIDTLYEFNAGDSKAVTKQINGPYVGTGLRTIQLGFPIGGDFIYFVQDPATGNATTGFFTYNTKTGALANLISSSVIDAQQTYSLAQNVWIYPGLANGNIDSNSARIVYVAQTGTNPKQLSLFSVPISGGTPVRLNKLYSSAAADLVVSGVNICPDATESFCQNLAPACQQCNCPAQFGCSLYIVFSQPDPDNTGRLTFYYALADGATDSAVAITSGNIAGMPPPEVLRIWAVDSGAPLIALKINFDSNPAGLYINRVTTVVSPSSTKVNSGIAASVDNSTEILRGIAGGNWLVFHSTTSSNPSATFPDRKSQKQFFFVKFDGTGVTRVNPPLASTDTLLIPSDRSIVSPNSKYFVFMVERQQTGTPATKTYMFSSTVGTSPTLVNLTPLSITGSGDVIGTIFFGSDALIDCKSLALVYKASLPDFGDKMGLFSIALTGGETVRLSQMPTSFGSVSSFRISQLFFRVYFFNNPHSVSDLFTNSAFAGMLVPSLMWLSMVWLFVTFF